MPYVKAQKWRDINTRLKTAEERVVELESPPEVEAPPQPEREKRPKARGGSCYGINGWDITFYKDSAQLEQSDIKVYPEKGYNFKIEKWRKDGDDIYLEIHSSIADRYRDMARASYAI